MDQQPTNYTVETPNAPQNGGNKGLAIATLICGIASLASSAYGVGLVCAIVALVLSKKYKEQATAENKMVKIGRILGIIGLVCSIVALVFWIGYFACVGCVICAAGSSGASY